MENPMANLGRLINDKLRTLRVLLKLVGQARHPEFDVHEFARVLVPASEHVPHAAHALAHLGNDLGDGVRGL